jgi:hypothetical protein
VPPPLAPRPRAALRHRQRRSATSGINIINNNSVGGAASMRRRFSPSTGKADFNIDGRVCLRELYTASAPRPPRCARSIEAIKRTGNLHGKPAIIVHGRADTLIPINHTSRPYYALNKSVDSGEPLSPTTRSPTRSTSTLRRQRGARRATTRASSRCTATSSRRWT